MHIGGDGLKCQELTQAPDSYGMAEDEGEGTSRGREGWIRQRQEAVKSGPKRAFPSSPDPAP